MPLYPAIPMPVDWIISNEAADEQVSSGTGQVANGVYLYAFEVRASTPITSLSYRMGPTTTGTTDMGIYDVNGNLLGHTGVITNTAGNTITTAITFTLSSGQYYLALCPSNNTDTYQRVNLATNQSPFSRVRLATNAGTAGVLPATTGGTGLAGIAPSVAAHVQGGLA